MMTTRNRTALAGALAACLSALLAAPAAHAETLMDSAYVKGEIGGGFAGGYDGPGSDLDSNVRWGLGAGARLSRHVRLEGEYIHDHADFDAGGGATSANLGMANIYYDFAEPGRWGIIPFIGGGVGGGEFKAPGASDSSFAYQAIGGLSKDISPRLTAEIAYKYLDAPNLSFFGADAEFHSSFVTAGLRYRFGG